MDRALVLGVTEQGVQLITETELSAVENALATEAAPAAAGVGPGTAETAEATEDHLPELQLQPAGSRSALDGSVLSPKTWRQLVDTARELTVRR